MNNFFLENIINKKLNHTLYQNDYSPNGLQIEGKSNIKRIITGVTACQKLINVGIYLKVDAIIVHHGYFWKNESKRILGMKRERIKKILTNNINLYSWHLPLDVNNNFGNNVGFSKILNIKIKGKIFPFGLWGIFKEKIKPDILIQIISKKYKKKPFYYGPTGPKYINRVAWCSGKGQNLISKSLKFNIDAFLTGEVSEETIHIAEENNIHFFSLGHHVTEIYGIKMLGKWLSKIDKSLFVKFININNPI